VTEKNNKYSLRPNSFLTPIFCLPPVTVSKRYRCRAGCAHGPR